MNRGKNTSEQEQRLRENIKYLKKEIYNTCSEAGRDVDDVTIIAATKYASAEQVRLLSGLGVEDFGENRAEELREKYDMAQKNSVWHFIGHLQRRKVKIVVPRVEFIHSIDKISTLSKVDDESKKHNKIQKLLIELNISGEETKYGMDTGDIFSFINKALGYRNIKIVGLMTMAPLTDDFKLIRGIFRRLRFLKNDLNKDFKDLKLTELSMGMSNDFKVAIEEGATMIRIGSMIFK